jgi:hypothetical protein
MGGGVVGKNELVNTHRQFDSHLEGAVSSVGSNRGYFLLRD